jgi:hypothetical protein
MIKFASVAVGSLLSVVVMGACGGGDEPGGSGGAGGGGAGGASGGAGGAAGTGGSGAGAGGGGSGGAGTGGAGTGGAGGGGMDAAAGDGGAAIPTGDHFCMVKKMEALQWSFGFDSRCVITETPMGGLLPPATVKMQIDNACTYVHGGTLAQSCPRDNMVAYCTGGFAPAGAKSTVLVYNSKLTPDAEHVALNVIAHCAGATVRDPGGQVVARACKGTVSAKVDGQMVAFSKVLNCWYKSDGTRGHYLIDASSANNANIKLAFVSQGGTYGYDTDPLGFMGAGYSEGVTAFALPANPAARTVNVTKFAARGAGLTATFSVGELRAGSSMVRTITEGSIDIQLAAP